MGNGTKGVFDFFKLYRTISKTAIIGNSTNKPRFENLESEVEIHKDQLVFDDQCYMYRTKNANFSFKKLKNTNETVFDSKRSIVMHLLYVFQGRRMMSDIYALDSSNTIISGNEETSECQNKRNQRIKSLQRICKRKINGC